MNFFKRKPKIDLNKELEETKAQLQQRLEEDTDRYKAVIELSTGKIVESEVFEPTYYANIWLTHIDERYITSYEKALSAIQTHYDHLVLSGVSYNHMHVVSKQIIKVEK